MAQRTVLVVDDDEPIQELLTAALRDKGYLVLLSHNGASLGVAHNEQPGVILLDLTMPCMGWVEVSRRLKGDAATAHIPVIALSSGYQGWTAHGLLADDWLGKPFHLDTLYEVVAKWMPPAAVQ